MLVQDILKELVSELHLERQISFYQHKGWESGSLLEKVPWPHEFKGQHNSIAGSRDSGLEASKVELELIWMEEQGGAEISFL